MARGCVEADLDAESPPLRPSAWQLRFGKRSAMRGDNSLQDDAKVERDAVPHADVGARSPSILEQLMRTLDKASRQKETFSRECADALLGRQNAFASGPELRMPAHNKIPGPGENQSHTNREGRGVAVEAREIIRLRLQVESQADKLRMGQQERRRHHRQHQPRVAKPAEGRCMDPVIPVNGSISGVDTSGRAQRKVRETTLRQETVTRGRRESHSHKLTVAPPTKASTQELQRRTRCKITANGVPPARDPLSQKQVRRLPQTDPREKMERRQQQLRKTREARKLRLADEQQRQKSLEPAPIENNQEDDLEQQRLEEQIELLTMENQRAAVLEERLETRKARARALTRVLSIWQCHVALRHQQEAQALAAFQWRMTKRIVSSWHRLALQRRQEKVAAQARTRLAQEQQLHERAVQFHRSRRLPLWFYRWASVVAQRKEQRVVAAAAEKRRVQAQILLEKMRRNSARLGGNQEGERTARPEVCNTAQAEAALSSEARSIRSPTTDTGDPHSTRHRRILKHPRKAKSSVRGGDASLLLASAHDTAKLSDPQSPLGAPPAAPFRTTRAISKQPVVTVPVDPLYQAMEQRAEERKRRREALKRKYEQQAQKCREAQEAERAARDALLAQQRAEERARVRERKVAEARALKDKQERREKMLVQRHEAAHHNRRRLLFYYALLPWRRQLKSSQRVAHNARRWHELREMHAHWKNWQAFTQMRRRLRRRYEREQLALAARHEAIALQRHAFQGWILVSRLTAARALAVKRQTRWNALKRAWRHWHLRLVDVYKHQRQCAHEAAAKLQRQQLRRICQQWRSNTLEAQHQRELQHEKEQLWSKVRGWLNEKEA